MLPALLLALVQMPATLEPSSLVLERARAGRLAGAGPPDLVLVVLDDVAAVDLALWGGPVACPALEGLAAQGVRFDRAYANPTCAPTRRSLLSGRWWVTGNGSPCSGDPVVPETPTAGDLLPALLPWYTSGLAGKWHLGVNPLPGQPAELAPLAHGFEFWSAGHATNVGECGGSSYTAWVRVDAWMPGGVWTSGASVQHEALAVRGSFVSGWGQVPGPRLGVVCGNLAHSPFHVPPASLLPPGYVVGSSPRARFEAMVVASDGVLSAVLGAVDLGTTVVVVVGDNGTPPNVAPVGAKAKGTTFERGVRVPLVVAGAGVASGLVVDELVHAVDVWATLAELGGASSAGRDGVSLVPLLQGGQGPVREWCLLGSRWGSTDGDVASVRSNRTKLRQLDDDGDGVVERLEFYDLASDPGETVNLVSDPAWGLEIVEHLAWTASALP